MRRTPPGHGGVLSKNGSKDFSDHAVDRENTPPLPRLSNIAAAFPLAPALWTPIGAIAIRVVLRILPDFLK